VVPKQPDLRHILSLSAVLHGCLKRLHSHATPQNYSSDLTAASVTVHSVMYSVHYSLPLKLILYLKSNVSGQTTKIKKFIAMFNAPEVKV
jgi:hypothetical protein